MRPWTGPPDSVTDGSLPEWARPAQGGLDRLRAACDRAGRDFDGLQIVNGERQDVRLDAEATDIKEKARRVVDAVAMYESMGVTHIKAGIGATDTASALRVIEWYGSEVLPALR